MAYVTGSKMAMVPIGPIPGNTPMKVPIDTPRKTAQRFACVKRTEKP